MYSNRFRLASCLLLSPVSRASEAAAHSCFTRSASPEGGLLWHVGGALEGIGPGLVWRVVSGVSCLADLRQDGDGRHPLPAAAGRWLVT
jgi:hypothetical protein